MEDVDIQGSYENPKTPQKQKKSMAVPIIFIIVIVIAIGAIVAGIFVLKNAGIIGGGSKSESQHYETGSDEESAFVENDEEDYASSEIHEYRLFNYEDLGLGRDYDAWQDYCERQGGYLSVINSEEENDYIYDVVLKNNNPSLDTAFFGLTDRSFEGEWRWINGDPLTYTNWSSYNNQPNNGAKNANGKQEDFAQFYMETKDGTWNDAPEGSNSHWFICEIE